MKSVRRLSLGLVFVALMLTSLPALGQQPNTSATITWGEDRDLRTLDPRVTESRHEAQVIMQVFESLIFRDTDGKFYPWLADSWQYSPDGKSITFKLRRGVRFHDGTPFTAEAVKFTFDSIKNPKLGSKAAIDFLGPYAGTDIVDSHTVRVRWNEPFGPALTNLSNPWLLSIVSPSAVKKAGDDGFAQRPVGTGPFKFVEWVPKVRVVLERNDEYRWAPRAFKHQGPARVRRLVIRIIPDASTRVAALEKGEIDVADQVPPVAVRSLRGNNSLNVLIGDVSGIPLSFLFNVAKEPLDDVNVRRAFIHAVNRPAIVQKVLFGTSKAAFGPITPTTPGYWAGVEQMYPYDPERAKKLLDEAGWKVGADGIRAKDGKSLEVYLPWIFDRDVPTEVQAAVKAVGIKLNFEIVPPAKEDEIVLNNQYNIGGIRWVAVDPSVMSVMLHSRNIPAPGKYAFNWSRFSSEQMDRLLARADATVNPQQRNRVLAEIQKLAIEQAVMMPIHISTQPVGYRRSVRDLKFAQGSWQVLFYDAWVSR
jgi:peptide/nickel transport system substrate-binding protein